MRLYYIDFWLRTKNPEINKLQFVGLAIARNYMDATEVLEMACKDFIDCEFELIRQSIDVQLPEFNIECPVIIISGEQI